MTQRTLLAASTALLMGLFVATARTAAVPCYGLEVPVCEYVGDMGGFLFEGEPGPLRLIDFETLPDGSTSYAGADITPSFNYTALGVSFVAPWNLQIAGTPGNFRLESYHPVYHTWIDAEFVIPTRAVGVLGTGTLYAYDAQGTLLASPFCNQQSCGFVGVISDIPIASIRLDHNSNLAIIRDFIFNPVPEPASGLLLAIAVGTLQCRCRSRK